MPSVYDCFVYDGKKVPHLQRKWELRHPDGAIRPDVGRKCFSSSRVKTSDAFVYVLGLSNSPDALLEAEKRTRREVAVVLDSVPTRLDAAHVRFVFIDVMGNGHCVLQCAPIIDQAGPARECKLIWSIRRVQADRCRRRFR